MEPTLNTCGAPSPTPLTSLGLGICLFQLQKLKLWVSHLLLSGRAGNRTQFSLLQGRVSPYLPLFPGTAGESAPGAPLVGESHPQG